MPSPSESILKLDVRVVLLTKGPPPLTTGDDARTSARIIYWVDPEEAPGVINGVEGTLWVFPGDRGRDSKEPCLSVVYPGSESGSESWRNDPEGDPHPVVNDDSIEQYTSICE